MVNIKEVKCNCQLCRQRAGDLRTNEQLTPQENIDDFVARIYSMVPKTTQFTVPDTEVWRKIYFQYKKMGYNMKIKTDEIIL